VCVCGWVGVSSVCYASWTCGASASVECKEDMFEKIIWKM